MSIRVLRNCDMGRVELKAAVCVIGAGIAGLIAATELARQIKRPVVVLESGLRDMATFQTSLNALDNPSGNYDGSARARILGGTSSLWAGKLLPLSAGDTAARPWLGLEAWPLDPTELERYRPQIERLMGVDEKPYDSVSPEIDPRGLLPQTDSDFVCRWPKRPTAANHQIAYVLRDRIADLGNLDIWLGATVVKFAVDPTSTRLERVEALDETGRQMSVNAKEFLLAAGTLESTRLLLLADRQANDCISRTCNALGHYFNDHLGLEIAALRPRDVSRTNAALSDRRPFGALRHLHFELRPEIQRQLGTASAYFDIAATLPDGSALNKTKQLVQALRHRDVGFAGADAAALLRDSPSLIKTAWWQTIHRQKYWPRNAELWLKVWAEQQPERRNRLTLSDSLGPLQMPLIKLDWHPASADGQLFRTMMSLVRDFWERSFGSICSLDWRSDLEGSPDELLSAAHDLAHPAGSARMGTRPSDSVVDATLRVHQLPNLSVASAAVFPSSGSANPTLTIMELAMHAARHIAHRVGRT